MNEFTCLQTFIAVVDNNSFSKAAAKHYTSTSALSKQVSWLEARFKTKLLNRTTRALYLTEAGQHCYTQAKQWLANFDQLKQAVSHMPTEPQGELSVTAPITFGETVLTPALTQFLAQYPKIKLNLQLTNAHLNLIQQGVDIAIRTNSAPDKSYQKYVIGEKSLGLFASPHYLKQHPNITQPRDLAQHQCLIHTDFFQPITWAFKSTQVKVTPHLLSNSLQSLINAALAGQGIIYLSEYTVEKHIQSKQLKPILKDQWPAPIQHLLLHLHTLYPDSKIISFVKFIQSLTW